MPIPEASAFFIFSPTNKWVASAVGQGGGGVSQRERLLHHSREKTAFSPLGLQLHCEKGIPPQPRSFAPFKVPTSPGDIYFKPHTLLMSERDWICWFLPESRVGL